MKKSESAVLESLVIQSVLLSISMPYPFGIITALVAFSLLFASPILATPVVQARAVQVYVYMSPTPVAVAEATAVVESSCPDAIITAKSDCPSGCTAAGIAGMIGVATDSWSCVSKPPATSWTSVQATSTCSADSTVRTYTAWGGETELGCHKTAS